MQAAAAAAYNTSSDSVAAAGGAAASHTAAAAAGAPVLCDSHDRAQVHGIWCKVAETMPFGHAAALEGDKATATAEAAAAGQSAATAGGHLLHIISMLQPTNCTYFLQWHTYAYTLVCYAAVAAGLTAASAAAAGSVSSAASTTLGASVAGISPKKEGSGALTGKLSAKVKLQMPDIPGT